MEFAHDTLATDDANALGIAREGVEGFVVDEEIELCRKTHAAQHAQRIVGESDVGVERCADEAILQIIQAIERVDKFAEMGRIQTHGQGVNGEISAVLIVFQCAIFHMRFARIVAVALLACAHKFHFHVTIFHLRCAKVFKHAEVGFLAQRLLQRVGHLYATAHDHHIDVVGRAL